MLLRKILVLLFITSQKVFCFSIDQKPVCQLFTPKELYQNKVSPRSFAGDRSRVSTCGGVGWFHDDNYLATVNFEGEFICTYAFNKSDYSFTPVQVIHGTKQACLESAENLSFSKDGTLLAVSINHLKRVNIYRVNIQTHFIDPVPLMIIKHQSPCVHGVRFAHEKYLVCTTVRGENIVTVYRQEEKDNKIKFTIISQLTNSFLPLKPKSLDFTQDDNHVAIVYSANVVAVASKPEGLIAIYKFDKNTGIIDPEPTSVYKNSNEFQAGEDINFYPDDSCVMISDQVSDKIIGYAFDKSSGKLGDKIFELQSTDAQISFPHGINISSDGRYLAVANYGDDKVSVYLATRILPAGLSQVSSQ